MQRILIIQGHPDNTEQHFCHLVAEKYASAAKSSGHEIKQISVADLALPLLTSKRDFENSEPSDEVKSVQRDIEWAEHLVVVYPIWLGDMPAVLKGFFEQVLRPGFAFSELAPGAEYKKLMKGKSARIIATMGMPTLIYRWFYRAHAVKIMKRNILSFCGFKPVRFKLIGGTHNANRAQLHEHLRDAAHLGRIGQ